ncbi:hypothetical protein R5R35_000586 [Gryllus longicercus]|uniref:DUF4773 domain-containing protein n=1 Tax=Gryllus longicercus TaxID=2509291 RepID=A0AAN9Z3Q9_9ORTH
MWPKTPVAAALAVVAAAALLALAADAHPAPEPDPFIKDLVSHVDKGIKTVGRAVKNVIRRLRAGCSCTQAKLSCRCCSPVKVEELKFNKEVCLRTRFRLSDFTAHLNVLVNKRVIGGITYAANKTPPICLPVPKVPVLRVCVQGHGFAIINNKFRLCIKLIVKLVSQTIAVITFDCLHLKLPRKG